MRYSNEALFYDKKRHEAVGLAVFQYRYMHKCICRLCTGMHEDTTIIYIENKARYVTKMLETGLE